MDNNLYPKSYAFSIRIVNAYQLLSDEKKEFTLSKQLLQSGTNICANIAETNGTISKAAFSVELSISYKECLQTKYWLSPLKDSGFIDTNTFESILEVAD